MNKIDLTGRAAVVTGAARGIGYAIAHRLLQSGASVSIWDIDPAALRSAGQRLSEWGRVVAEEVDVADENAVSRATQSTVQRFGKIDILVNNAGIGGPIVQTWEYDLSAFRKIMDVNVVGVFLVVRVIREHERPA